MDWIKVSSAIFLVLMLFFLLPRAKHMLTNSPKPEARDWQAALIALLGVVGFVALLAWLVSQ